jgi:hypothetical protein
LFFFVAQAPSPEEKERKTKTKHAACAKQSKLLANEQGQPRTAMQTQDGITTKIYLTMKSRNTQKKGHLTDWVTRSVVASSPVG